MSVPLGEAIPDAPFTTLLGIVKTCRRPSARGSMLEELKVLAAGANDEEMRVFRDELQAALSDPSQVPLAELRRIAGYADGEDREFLWYLWTGLYGGDPVTAPAEMRLVACPAYGAE